MSHFKRTIKSHKNILCIVYLMGRPKKYFSEEERKQANKQIKTKYMLNKEWLCPECGNRNYTLAGKWSHLKTKKPMRNAQAIQVQEI